MSWVFKDEETEFTAELRDSLGQGATAFVPPLWLWEVANVLLCSERAKRLSAADAEQHLLFLSNLPIEVDEASAANVWTRTQVLARAHRLTTYDGAYLELAIRRGLPLASLDSDLRKAAQAEKVILLPERI